MKFNVDFVDKNDEDVEKMMMREEGLVPQVTFDYIDKHLSKIPPEAKQWVILGTAVGVKVAFAHSLYQKRYGMV